MLEYKPVLFKLGNETYGVDIAKVQGIENEQDVIRIPNTASYIKGIMNLRGKIIPVYNLRNKFGMPDEEGEKQYIIVDTGGVTIALEVDKVDEIFNATDIHDAPVIVKGGTTAYIDKVVNLGDRIVVTIDVYNLLSTDEKDSIENMVNSMYE
ncbi:MAG: chemotaxis protein CheW [Lachnospiraceae bacterium]|nr:chemotaxis protein CheW [Lachnospiraceae bacterium]